MKLSRLIASVLFASASTQAYTISSLTDASTNGSNWVGATAPSQILTNPSNTPNTNEWFSRYATNNGDSAFNINANLLSQFKNAPAQNLSGAGLTATSSSVKVTFLGTGAARDSFLFLAQASANPFDTNGFWNPIYASGGTNNLSSYNPVNASNSLFETRGGCSYATAKAGNTCVPTNLGQSREITGLNAGDNLVFGLQALVLDYNADNIHYSNTNYFFSGQASNNTDPNHWNDGRVHTKALNIGNGKYLVGFEDTWGGGDNDFNDNIFLFEGVSSSIDIPKTDVPEPKSIALVLIGLGLIGFLRRKNHSA